MKALIQNGLVYSNEFCNTQHFVSCGCQGLNCEVRIQDFGCFCVLFFFFFFCFFVLSSVCLFLFLGVRQFWGIVRWFFFFLLHMSVLVKCTMGFSFSFFLSWFLSLSFFFCLSFSFFFCLSFFYWFFLSFLFLLSFFIGKQTFLFCLYFLTWKKIPFFFFISVLSDILRCIYWPLCYSSLYYSSVHQFLLSVWCFLLRWTNNCLLDSNVPYFSFIFYLV